MGRIRCGNVYDEEVGRRIVKWIWLLDGRTTRVLVGFGLLCKRRTVSKLELIRAVKLRPERAGRNSILTHRDASGSTNDRELGGGEYQSFCSFGGRELGLN